MFIKPKKSLGQNFLIDRNVLEQIVDTVNITNKEVLEIGPGSGNLTTFILKKNPKKLFVIEKDDDLALLLEDKFTNEVTYRSPLLEDLNFTKFVKNDNIVYYLSCNTIGSTVVVDGKGVILLLDNGEKIEWPEEKIDVKVRGGNYVYSCFIRLSSEDIAKLQQNNISDFRLYIYDNKVENSEKYKQYINCMVNQE